MRKYYGRRGQITRFETHEGLEFVWMKLCEKEKVKPRIGIVNHEGGVARKMMIVPSESQDES